jgi:predicted secreted Zn-dependent protease
MNKQARFVLLLAFVLMASLSCELFRRKSVGRFPVTVGGKSGYMDKTGKVVVNPQFDSAGMFYEGLAAVKVGGQYGYVDSAGKVVISPQFDRGSYFSNGRW